MGRHDIGEDGISYLHREAEKGMVVMLRRIHHRCIRFVMSNGKEIFTIVTLHTVAFTIYSQIPFLPH